MKPTKIFDVLDLAWEARAVGKNINPLFIGDAGLGKSEIAQQWRAKQLQRNPNFGFLDLRIAYLEAPDMIGIPEFLEINGVRRSIHALPDFWPTEGEGLILIEEPNRGTTGCMNTLMQILTDRKVHKYSLPAGWIMAGCINPDSAEYDVNAMDCALRNRFIEFTVEYDHNTFVNYMDKSGWSESIQSFVKSGIWVYKDAKTVGKGQYISPRTWSQLEACEAAGVKKDRMFHDLVCRSILGKDIGREYWSFCHQQKPVMASDLLENPQEAFDRLKQQSSKDSYQGDLITASIESIVKHYGGRKDAAKNPCKEDQVDEDLMAEVAKIIPSDQAVNLIKECGKKQTQVDISTYFKNLIAKHQDLIAILKGNIHIQRVQGAPATK